MSVFPGPLGTPPPVLEDKSSGIRGTGLLRAGSPSGQYQCCK